MPEPIYEVGLSGNRPAFQIALPPNGGAGRVVAGDLDGYFIDTARGFRFIPTSVLQVAVRERQRNKYEVLGRDADGRPTRVRISAASLTIIDHVPPQYPQSARQRKIEGEVRVSAIIGTNGRVQDVTVISRPSELHDAAIGTTKKWRFKPFQLDGHAVEVESQFMFNYAFGSHVVGFTML